MGVAGRWKEEVFCSPPNLLVTMVRSVGLVIFWRQVLQDCRLASLGEETPQGVAGTSLRSQRSEPAIFVSAWAMFCARSPELTGLLAPDTPEAGNSGGRFCSLWGSLGWLWWHLGTLFLLGD